MKTVLIEDVINEGRHALQPSTNMAAVVRDHVFNNFQPMMDALIDLMFCPALTREVAEKDPVSHKALELARITFRDAVFIEVEEKE